MAAKKNNLRLAKVVSIIGNPAFLGLFFICYFYFFQEQNNINENLKIAFQIITIMVIPTAIYLFWKVNRGDFYDYDVSNRNKRKSLYQFVLLSFGLLLVSIFIFENPPKARLTISIIFLQLLFSSFCNQWIKISLHAGFNFLFAFLFYPINPIISLALFLFGFANIWSRIQLRRHNFKEVLAGMALGILNGSAYIYLFYKI